MTRPGEEWRRDVHRRYVAMSAATQEHAKLQFLRILRSLPYGNSVFFSVKRMEDPIGLLPSELILGINKRGVHLFRPVPKEYLHSTELRDIMQFGSSSQAIFFKMRVTGVLHIFRFETCQGDDICMALQTHITDIMMKRFLKAKKQRGSANSSRRAQVKLSPEYDQHLKKMQKNVEETTMRIEELEKKEKEATSKVQEMHHQLEGIRTSLASCKTERMDLQSEISAARKAIDAAKEELHNIQAVCSFLL